MVIWTHMRPQQQLTCSKKQSYYNSFQPMHIPFHLFVRLRIFFPILRFHSLSLSLSHSHTHTHSLSHSLTHSSLLLLSLSIDVVSYHRQDVEQAPKWGLLVLLSFAISVTFSFGLSFLPLSLILSLSFLLSLTFSQVPLVKQSFSVSSCLSFTIPIE